MKVKAPRFEVLGLVVESQKSRVSAAMFLRARGVGLNPVKAVEKCVLKSPPEALVDNL